MPHQNNEAGRSMIEMLGVLAIIGVLSVGGIAGYSKAMMQYKINKTVDQISQVVSNVRTLFGNQKTYSVFPNWYNSEASKNVIRKAHLVPDEMWNTNGTELENAFGGHFYINYACKKSECDNKAFGIYLDGVPEEACMALATYDWGSGSSSGLLAVGVNSGSPAALFHEGASVGGKSDNNGAAIAVPNGSIVSVPMPVNVAATACQEGDSNEISINFY